MHRQATDFKDLHAHAWHCTLMVSGFFNRTADSTEEAHCQAPGSEKSSMIDISMNLAATKECACRKSCDVQMKNDQPRTSTARTAQTSRILRKLLIICHRHKFQSNSTVSSIKIDQDLRCGNNVNGSRHKN